MDPFGSFGELLGWASNLRMRMDSAASDPYQEELAAIAGPKTETGCHLPVKNRLHKEPWGLYGAQSVMCMIEARPVGYLHPRKLLSDVWLQTRLEEAALTGEPVVIDGYIVGGWSRGGGKDQADYKVRSGFDLGDGALDADMKEVLELEDQEL